MGRQGRQTSLFFWQSFFLSSENPAFRWSSDPSESDANGGTSCCLKCRGASGLYTIWRRRRWRGSCAGACQPVAQPCVRACVLHSSPGAPAVKVVFPPNGLLRVSPGCGSMSAAIWASTRRNYNKRRWDLARETDRLACSSIFFFRSLRSTSSFTFFRFFVRCIISFGDAVENGGTFAKTTSTSGTTQRLNPVTLAGARGDADHFLPHFGCFCLAFLSLFQPFLECSWNTKHLGSPSSDRKTVCQGEAGSAIENFLISESLFVK